ncbi:MAG TPA: hypothetical protein V6C65_23630 [Allocoleopsis sp.]
MNELPSPNSIANLFQLLHDRQIPYLLVGGVAMLAYVEGRNTQDIDLLVYPEAIEALPELEVSSRDGNFARATLDGLQIDLLLTSNRLFLEVMREFGEGQAILHSFGSQQVKVIRPTGLAILKLYALPSLYRQGRFQRANLYESDITALKLEFPELNLDSAVARLNGHLLDSDIQEVQGICYDIVTRVNRMKG